MLGDKGSGLAGPDPTSLIFQTPILYGEVFKTLEAGLHIPYVDEVHMLELSVPQTKKPRRGGGLIQRNAFRKVPLQVNLFR